MAMIVAALGGNAILQPGQSGTYEEQMANMEAACSGIISLLREGHRVVLVHGNGPQVGSLLIQNEEASTLVPAMPLHACVAQTQGQLGYMLQQALGNELLKAGISMPVVTLVTQAEVSPDDPAFANPTKPVGPFYTEQRARRLMRDRGYVMAEDAGRGWRRVVPSPQPLRIVEGAVVASLLAAGTLVIASGGGGVPVVRNPDDTIAGIDAVIDKDMAAQKIAQELQADLFVILTDVERVALHWGTPEQKWLGEVSLDEMETYMAEGHFKSGSMGPKVEACFGFVSASPRNRQAVIGSLHKLDQIIKGQSGTWIVPRTGSQRETASSLQLS
jgi:carbamate kinase